MAGVGIQVESIELFQFLYAFQTVLIEGALSIEGMQDDAFQEISERQIAVFSEGLQNLQDPLFHADAGLDPFN
jgi:hypothetical protein